VDRLDVGVVGQRILAKLASNAGLLEPAKRYRLVQNVVLIDPDGSSVQRVCEFDRPRDILREDGRSQPVHGIIRNGNDIIIVLELAHDHDRSKDFIFHDGHVGLDVGEDGRLDEVSLRAVLLATHENSGSFLLALLNISHDTVELNLGYLRALEGFLVEWISNLERLNVVCEFLHELVINVLLDVYARTSAAALSMVEEDTEGTPLYGLVKIGVIADDVW